jgi:hypothetical protein
MWRDAVITYHNIWLEQLKQKNLWNTLDKIIKFLAEICKHELSRMELSLQLNIFF